MKRNDIIERLSHMGYTKRHARYIIDDIFKVISEALVGGEEVQIHGFGTFYVKDAAARETYDVSSGERITIPAHRIPKFTPGVPLRRWVRDGVMRE